MSNWIVFTLAATLFLSLADTLTKKVNKSLDEYSTAYFRNIFALPVWWTALFLVGFPKIDPNFWKGLILIMPIEIATAVCYFKAIKSSPLSLSVPFSAFIPVTTSIGAFFILKETINPTLLIGLLFLVSGAYLINLDHKQKDFLAPFKAIKKERGPQLMLLAAILLSLTQPVGKILLNYSSSYFYTAVYFSTFCIFFTPIFFKNTTNTFSQIKLNVKALAMIGTCNGLFLLTLWIAIGSGPVGGVNALLRITILLTVLMAGTFLSEGQIIKRLIASSFMVVGAVIVALFS